VKGSFTPQTSSCDGERPKLLENIRSDCPKDPGAVSKLLQGLFTSVSDTASSSWGSVDAIGEIICALPIIFPGSSTQLVQISRDPRCFRKSSALWGKSVRPDLTCSKILVSNDPLLAVPTPSSGVCGDPSRASQGYEAKEDLIKLKEDMAPIDIYRTGRIEKTTLHQLAIESLAKL